MRESRIKLEDIILDAVVDENPEFKADVTQKPVETGQDISDYMKQRPLKIRLEGHCVKDAAAKHEKLRNYQKEKKLLKYNGRGIYTNVVISNLNTKHNTNNAFGFDFEIELTCVRIAKPEEFKVETRDPDGKDNAKTATKTRAKTKTGRQQMQKLSGKAKTQLDAMNSKNWQGTGAGPMRYVKPLIPGKTYLTQGTWKGSLKDKYTSSVKTYYNQKTEYKGTPYMPRGGK